MKQCKRCLNTFPLDRFYARSRMKDGLSNWCKGCELDANRAWRGKPGVRERQNELARKRGPRDPGQAKRHALWSWYRITPEQFDALLAAQGGKCAIPACGATEPGGHGTWHVDHDHACCSGKKSCGNCVRGLLCSRCNPMLGMARDDAEILRSAVDYLTNNALQQALGAIGG